MDKVNDVFLHQIATPGLPGNISDAEAQAIRADQAALLARPVIDRLQAIPNVTDEPVHGETIVYDEETDTFVAGQAGGTIAQIGNAGTTDMERDVRWISVRNGLRMLPSTPGVVFLEGIFGTSGTRNVIAREDHTHVVPLDAAFPFPASGSLSSGTRTLVSSSVTGLNPDKSYVLTGTLLLDLRGEGSGAGTSTPRISIWTETSSRHAPARTVAGVDREATTLHEGVIIGGVTAVAVRAFIQFTSGDPVYVNAGQLTIRIKPNR